MLVWLARLRPESSVALPPVRRLPFGFDDDEARGAAEVDPVGFVGDLPKRAILNKVQRVPALFAALKTAVDRHRLAGRFILTGSANVLLVPKLADSLAGRMEILRLHPLTQGELARRQPRFLDALFAGTRLTAARGALRRRNERSLRRRRTLGQSVLLTLAQRRARPFYLPVTGAFRPLPVRTGAPHAWRSTEPAGPERDPNNDEQNRNEGDRDDMPCQRHQIFRVKIGNQPQAGIYRKSGSGSQQNHLD